MYKIAQSTSSWRQSDDGLSVISAPRRLPVRDADKNVLIPSRHPPPRSKLSLTPPDERPTAPRCIPKKDYYDTNVASMPDKDSVHEEMMHKIAAIPDTPCTSGQKVATMRDVDQKMAAIPNVEFRAMTMAAATPDEEHGLKKMTASHNHDESWRIQSGVDGDDLAAQKLALSSAGPRRTPLVVALVGGAATAQDRTEQSSKRVSKDKEAIDGKSNFIRYMGIVTVLVVLLAGGLTAGLVFGLSSSNDEEDDGFPDNCEESVVRLACTVTEWPGPGFVTLLGDCPSDGNMLECTRCSIFMPDSTDFDPTRDPICNSCTVCPDGVALNCSNLIEGACGVSNCAGQCIG